MSDNAHYQATEDAHTGPIKNPKQLLVTVFFAFVAPILIIVALVAYVVSGVKGSGDSTGSASAGSIVSSGSPTPGGSARCSTTTGSWRSVCAT